ncbi:DUF6311 domain-containing protein [Roseomonas rosulenta]|uniref:DUF6311 domain-containing protein n=1 Tax=Roseomonas rosulenta TaxID=2748667 RepID=UPI0018DF0775|nr:DUF6311 domain-containing protein [Roseomonas rosulenta]
MNPPRLGETAAALGIGAAVFVALLGPGVLDPANIAWMQRNDPAQYYLGWTFFRATPWGWPPAANPLFGTEIASTIFFTDVVPLMALVMKATIAPVTGPWQYHGAWLLLCFALQAAFAQRIAALFLPDAASRLMVAALACFAPVLLWRLNGPHAMTGHYALMAQWLLLAAGWLCLRPPPASQALAWVVLGVLAALIHPYLLAMVLAGWAADLLRRGWRAGLYVEVAAMAVGVAGGLWVAGFRMLPGGGMTEPGFGLYRANLLTLLDPQGWSLLIGGGRWGAGDYEGFGFLGLGGIVALLGALWLIRRDPPRLPSRGRWPLLAVVLALAAFAVSNVVALGPVVLAVIPVPAPLEPLLAIFRASGRMIWPLHYLVLLGAAILLARRLGPGRAPLALGLILALQVADGVRGWLPAAVLARITGPAWTTPLHDPFWDEAAGHYERLRRIPAANAAPGWVPLAYLAATHGIGTDSVYLARVAREPLAALRARGAEMVATGRFDPAEFYVLDDASACAAAARIDAGRDLLVNLDGMNVLAPGWLAGRPAPAAGRTIACDVSAPPGSR